MDEDKKKEFLTFYNDICRNVSPTKTLDSLEKYIRLIINKKLPLEEENYFIDNYLFKIIEKILSRDDYEISPQIINSFIMQVLDLILETIPNENPKILECLQHIFFVPLNKGFYLKFTNSQVKTISTEFDYTSWWIKNYEEMTNKKFKQKFYILDYTFSPKISTFLIENIEYFVKNGGFEKIITHFLSEKHRISFTNTYNLLRPISMASQFFHKGFLELFFFVGQKMLTKFATMTEEEVRNEKKQNIDKLIFSIISILSKKDSNLALQISEKLNINMIFRSLKSKFLENRVMAIAQLNEALDKIAIFENPKSNSSVKHWLSTKNLLEKLEKNNFIDLVFTETIHHDIVSRSLQILQFLAKQNKITKKIIDTIWDQYQQQHQSIIEVIYSVISQTAQYLDKNMFYYFLTEKIQKIMFWNKSSLSLLSDFAVLSLNKKYQKSNNTSNNPIFMLWEMMHNDELAFELRSIILIHLNQIFTKNNLSDDLRMVFFEYGLEKMNQSKNSELVIPFLKQIIEFYPQTKKQSDNRKFTRTEFVVYFEKNKKLVDILINEIVKFHTNISEMIQKNEPKVDINWTQPFLNSKLSLYQHFDLRFDFLQFLSKLFHKDFLNNSRIETLWKCFVKEKIQIEDQNNFFTFARNLSLTPELIEEFFNKAKTLKPKEMNEKSFLFFQFFCFNMNQKEKKVQGNFNSFEVNDPDISKIIGIDMIWDIALYCKSHKTSQMAIDFLLKMQKLQANLVEKHEAKIRKEFVDKCFGFLNNEKIGKKTKEKAISIIFSFVVDIEKDLIPEHLPFQRHYTSSRDDLIQLEVREFEKKDPIVHNIEVMGSESVFCVRKRIAEKLRVNPKQINVVTHGKMSEDKNSLFAIQAGLFENSQLLVRVEKIGDDTEKTKNTDKTSEKRNIEKQALPSFILSSHFNEFFGLLNISKNASNKIWKLILQMPTNEELHTKFLKLFNQQNSNEPILWNQFFDINSKFKMLYNLQIIHQIIQMEKRKQEVFDTFQGKKIRQTFSGFWTLQFYETGGLDSLVNVFVSLHKSMMENSQKIDLFFAESIALVLKSLFNFIVQEDKQLKFNNEIVLKTIEPNELAKKILELLSEISIYLNNFTILDTINISKFSMEIVEAITNTFGNSAVIFGGEKEMRHFLRSTILLSHKKQFRKIVVQFLSKICENEDKNEKDNSKENERTFQIKLLEQMLELLMEMVIEKDNVDLKSEENLDENLDENLNENLNEKSKSKSEENLNENLNLNEKSKSKSEENLNLNLNEKSKSFQNSLKSPSEDFFTFLEFLIRKSYQNEKKQDFSNLTLLIVRLIKERPKLEQGMILWQAQRRQPDETLIGYLKLLRTLVSNKKQNMLEILFQKEPEFVEYVIKELLFGVEAGEITKAEDIILPKCQTHESRQAALALLLEIARRNKGKKREIVKKCSELQINIKVVKEWGFDPILESRKINGYVGLRNLGATCYMNSLFQQLFMVPQFRTRILALETPQLEDSELYQFQVLMGFLSWSSRQYLNTRDFAKTFRDWDGNVLNVHLQADVDEFGANLFDKLGRKILETKDPQLLHELFEGKVVNQVIPQGEGQPSNRVEDFYTISLDVIKKKDLIDSFEQYIKEEMLVGENQYFSQELGRKVDALKRVCLHTLPKVLLLHLKRFEFNMETFQRYKVNDECQFPMELDLRKYTYDWIQQKENSKENEKENFDTSNKSSDTDIEKESSPKSDPSAINSCYQYQLAGVIVHNGSTDSGHYYSFIRERDPSQQNNFMKWFRFDDKRVLNYNETYLSQDCNGGKHKIRGYDNYGKLNDIIVDKTYSAYMLVYERKDFIEEEHARLSQKKSDANNTNKQKANQNIVEIVQEDNLQFTKKMILFDRNYLNFLEELLCVDETICADKDELENQKGKGNQKENQIEQNEEIEFATKFVFQILSHSRHEARLPIWMRFLASQYAKSLSVSKWFIQLLSDPQKGKNWFLNFFLQCPNEPFREQTGKLISIAIASVLPLERNILIKQREKQEKQQKIWNEKKQSAKEFLQQNREFSNEKIGETESTIVMLLENVIQLIPNMQSKLKNGYALFSFLGYLSGVDQEIKRYLKSRNIVARLIDLYLDSNSPLRTLELVFDPSRISTPSPQVINILKLLHSVLEENNAISFKALPSIDRVLIEKTSFIDLIINDGVDPYATGKLVSLMCFSNKQLTQEYITTLTLLVQERDSNLIEKYHIILGQMLQIRDSFFSWKLDQIMEIMITFLTSKEFSTSKAHASIKNIVEISRNSPEVLDWLFQRKDKWVYELLIANENMIAREETEKLIDLMIPKINENQNQNQNQLKNENENKPKKQLSDSELSKFMDLQLFLLGLLPRIMTDTYENIRPKQRPGKSYDPWPPSFYKLTHYFDILTKALIHPQAIQSFEDFFPQIWNLYIHIDRKTLACDLNKHHLFIFFQKFFETSPEHISLITNSKERLEDLIRYYISLNQQEIYIYYNKTSLPYYFRVLKQCLQNESKLIDQLYNAHTFRWAIENLLLSSIYQGVDDIIYEISLVLLQKIHFKRIQVELVLSGTAMNESPWNALRFLNAILDEDTFDLFAVQNKTNGFNLISNFMVQTIPTLMDQIQLYITSIDTPSRQEDIVQMDPLTTSALQAIEEPKMATDYKQEINKTFELISLALQILLKSSAWLIDSSSKKISLQKKEKISSSWTSKLQLLNSLDQILDVIDFNFPENEIVELIISMMRTLLSIINKEQSGRSHIHSLFLRYFSSHEVLYNARSVQQTSLDSEQKKSSYVFEKFYQKFLIKISDLELENNIDFLNNPKKGKKSTKNFQSCLENISKVSKLLLFYLFELLYNNINTDEHLDFIVCFSKVMENIALINDKRNSYSPPKTDEIKTTIYSSISLILIEYLSEIASHKLELFEKEQFVVFFSHSIWEMLQIQPQEALNLEKNIVKLSLQNLKSSFQKIVGGGSSKKESDVDEDNIILDHSFLIRRSFQLLRIMFLMENSKDLIQSFPTISQDFESMKKINFSNNEVLKDIPDSIQEILGLLKN